MVLETTILPIELLTDNIKKGPVSFDSSPYIFKKDKSLESFVGLIPIIPTIVIQGEHDCLFPDLYLIIESSHFFKPKSIGFLK